MKKLILPILITLALPLVFQSTPTEILKLKTFDALVKEQQPSGNFVILNISESDVRERGGYPFPRRDLAQIQVDLINEGAIGVGWSIAFPEADRFGGDEVFAQALSFAPSVLAMFETPNGQYPQTVGTVIKGNEVGGISTLGVVENINILKDKAYQGIATAPVDVDNLVRRIPLLMKTPDGWTSSFGTEILKALTGTRSYIITTNDNGIQEIAVRNLPPVKTDSFGRKWISWVDTPQTTLQEMSVAGKFVIIGVTANGVMPQVATPVGLLEPHKIQAALAESILIQDSPMIPDWSLAAEIAIFVTFVTLTWLLINYLGMTLGIVLAVLTMLGTASSGYWFIQNGILIDVTWTLISQFITGAIAFYLRFREQFKLRLQIKKQFEHYLDPRQVKQLQKNPELLKLGGEKRYATFLFTDVRGFTNLSEKLEPEEVTEIMNKALTVQVECVQRNGGMVDKFIGDACMAIFNAPMDLENHEEKAVKTAIEMQEAIKELNKELPHEIAIGVGTQSGYAVIGNMGSSTRFDYSAIGDAVNTAARLESATKEAGVDILIGENTAQSVNYKLKSLKAIKVKGKAKALKIYTIK
jgi:adenylate cyclase